MKKIALIAAVFLFAISAAGCAPRYTPPDYSRYVWPKPPQLPRLQLIKMIRTDLDIRQNTTAETLFGQQASFAFVKPQDVAVDRKGIIYVTDTYRKTTFAINPETGTVNSIHNPSRWNIPTEVAVDDANNLIAVSEVDGVYLFEMNSLRLIRKIGRAGEFIRPSGVAFDSKNKFIYISDLKANEVYKYDFNGNRKATVVKAGGKMGNVYYPTSIATDAEGNVYVADTMNFRIQIFDPDGGLINVFGEHGDKPGMFARPKGISVSKNKLILVTDADFGVFQIFDSEGRIYLYNGGVGSHPDHFAVPTGIFIDDNDRIYIVDQINRRVKIYQLYTDDYYAAHPEEAAKYGAEAQKALERAAELKKQRPAAVDKDFGSIDEKEPAAEGKPDIGTTEPVVNPTAEPKAAEEVKAPAEPAEEPAFSRESEEVKSPEPEPAIEKTDEGQPAEPSYQEEEDLGE